MPLPPQVLTRSPGHYRDWIRACKGGAPGVYNYSIGGTSTLAPAMDTSAITSGLAKLNKDFNQLPLTPDMAVGQAGS